MVDVDVVAVAVNPFAGKMIVNVYIHNMLLLLDGIWSSAGYFLLTVTYHADLISSGYNTKYL